MLVESVLHLTPSKQSNDAISKLLTSALLYTITVAYGEQLKGAALMNRTDPTELNNAESSGGNGKI
jgi:hypothetical protein